MLLSGERGAMNQLGLEQIIEMLRKVPFFSGVRRQDLVSLANLCRPKTYRARQVIFHRGDPGDTLYIVQSGQVKIVLLSAKGEEMVLALFQSGDFFGELSLLDGLPRSASATAVQTTVLLSVSRMEFQRVLRETPAMAEQVIGALTARLRHTDLLLGDAIFLTVAARLTKRLLELAETQGERDRPQGPVTIRVTQAELAAMVGATRESINKELRTLEIRGILQLGRSRVVLLRPELVQRPEGW
jgi:CRP-like cAMP-binding protein